MKRGIKPETPFSSPHPGKWKSLADSGVYCPLVGDLSAPSDCPAIERSIDLGDEGSLAYGAVRVMEGQVPHRDFLELCSRR